MATTRKVLGTILAYLLIGFMLYILVGGFFCLIRGIVAFYMAI